MTLNELKNKCDVYTHLGHGNDEVVITLSYPRNVGKRSYTCVTGFGPGFDFEAGEMRLTPLKRLVADVSTRDDPMAAYQVHTTVRTVYKCAKCGSHIRKKDKYCSECGQAIKQGEFITVNFGKL